MSKINLTSIYNLIANGLRIDASHVSNIYDILISGSECVQGDKIFNGVINKVNINDNGIITNTCTSSDNTGIVHGLYGSGYGSHSYTMANN